MVSLVLTLTVAHHCAIPVTDMVATRRISMTKKQNIKLQKLMTVAYNDYEKGLNARSFFKVHDHILGESLVQDTFSKTWAYLVKGGKILLMKAFLYHILNDLIIDEYRKKKSISLDVLIEKLPVKYRKIMNMRYLQDLTILEMATATGQTKNSLTVQLHRGLEKLKVLYNHA